MYVLQTEQLCQGGSYGLIVKAIESGGLPGGVRPTSAPVGYNCAPGNCTSSHIERRVSWQRRSREKSRAKNPTHLVEGGNPWSTRSGTAAGCSPFSQRGKTLRGSSHCRSRWDEKAM